MTAIHRIPFAFLAFFILKLFLSPLKIIERNFVHLNKRYSVAWNLKNSEKNLKWNQNLINSFCIIWTLNVIMASKLFIPQSKQNISLWPKIDRKELYEIQNVTEIHFHSQSFNLFFLIKIFNHRSIFQQMHILFLYLPLILTFLTMLFQK